MKKKGKKDAILNGYWLIMEKLIEIWDHFQAPRNFFILRQSSIAISFSSKNGISLNKNIFQLSFAIQFLCTIAC